MTLGELLGTPDGERIPDVAGEIVGYRAWRVRCRVLAPVRLWSIFNQTEWKPGRWTVARCNVRKREPIPHEHCGCGIYAARDRDHLVRQGYNDGDDRWTIAIGEVALAGDVIPGERGWRAEKGRPVRLWLAHQDWPLVKPLSIAYEIPVDLTNLLEVTHGHRT